MKVERQGSSFQPVVITLESQEEVDVLHELCGSVTGDGLARKITNDFYRQLGEYTLFSGGYFEDSVSTVE